MRDTFTLEPDDADLTIAAVLRRRIPELSWTKARAMCTRGQVLLDGARALDPTARVLAGQQVDVDQSRAAPKGEARKASLVFADDHLVVFDKPAGIASVPAERGERGTAFDLAKNELRRRARSRGQPPLFVVHRLDKETSGLITFARSRKAERALGALFREHDIERAYTALCDGQIRAQRIESRLVSDRGDGLSGSTREPDGGKRAVTHLRVLEPLPAATLLEVTLETGRTHQIRIHLAEAGHPIVGERVYDRDLRATGRTLIPSPRLLLHAARLGFQHPVTGRPVSLLSPLPTAYQDLLTKLRT